MNHTELLTVAQVATYLQVNIATVRAWLQTGRLNGDQLPGGGWRITPEAVESMLRSTQAKQQDD
jgi:excisionase family DNA binding protein